MCEKKVKQLGKVYSARLREARRLYQRLAMAPAATLAMVSPGDLAPRLNPGVDPTAQSKLILEIALRTITLMQRNSLIQQKLNDLRKETAEFMASVMNNPENKKLYQQHEHAPIKLPVIKQLRPSVINHTYSVEPKIELNA